MKKMWMIILVTGILAVGTSLLLANKANEGEGISITISPNTLVLSSEDTCVTVHSNIPYSTVNTVSLTLNGIPADFTKADACGDLVVKFDRADVKDIVEPGLVTLTLAGELNDGTLFEASDSITVKE